MKTKHDFATKADVGAEKIILGLIAKKFPSHRILSEEAGWSGPPKSDYLWLVDPLDGTTNFAVKNPLFNVSLALTYLGEVILGVVYAPYLKELYLAERGRGAFLNDRKMKVTGRSKISDSFITFCHSHDDANIKKIIKLFGYFKPRALSFRQLGAGELELGLVAAGRTDAFLLPGANLWDVAAGVLFVREAGGMATDFSGRPWNLTSKDLLASNGKIHKELLGTIRKVLK